MSGRNRKGWVATIAAAAATAALAAGNWLTLQDDGLHDASNPALRLLQQPEDALGVLTPDTAGNKVDWVQALDKGEIRPRASLDGSGSQQVLDQDIVMTATMPLPYVRFPHRPHSEWMACATCHEALFVSRTGANDISMATILEGRHCGVCHGAVAFPLTECNRCHSVAMQDAAAAIRPPDAPAP